MRDALKFDTKNIKDTDKAKADVIVRANQHLALSTKIEQYRFTAEVLKDILREHYDSIPG